MPERRAAQFGASSSNQAIQQFAFQAGSDAKEYLEFFAQHKDSNPKKVQRWKPPPQDILKINVDGSFHSDKKCGGWGFVIRDHMGDVIGAGAGRVEYAQDVLQVEAEACVHALNYAQEWGMTNVLVETDAQILVQTITDSKNYDLAPNGVLFREINALAMLHFSSFSISFCPRVCNNVVDALATHG